MIYSAVEAFREESLPDMLKRLLHVPAMDRERVLKLVFRYVCD